MTFLAFAAALAVPLSTFAADETPPTPAAEAPATPAPEAKPAEPPKPPVPLKRIEIDKTHQTLMAFEGEQLFLKTRISSGRNDRSTPNGEYTALEKHRMHYSKKYHNAPMPFAIWVSGNCFIHGFSSVPSRPASHGCIRVPLSEGNPAKRLFEWTEVGIPVKITGHWPE